MKAMTYPKAACSRIRRDHSKTGTAAAAARSPAQAAYLPDDDAFMRASFAGTIGSGQWRSADRGSARWRDRGPTAMLRRNKIRVTFGPPECGKSSWTTRRIAGMF
jgi:hypothetical protein